MTELTLRNGGKVLVRELRQDDRAALRRFYETMSDEVAFFFEPYQTMNEQVLDHVFSSQSSGKEAHYVVQNSAGEFVAHCFLLSVDTDIPEIGIGIIEGYQNQGLGHVLMVTLIDLARNLAKPAVRLTVFVENTRAHHLYEKLGFVEVGRRAVRRGPRFLCAEMVLIEMRLGLA